MRMTGLASAAAVSLVASLATVGATRALAWRHDRAHDCTLDEGDFPDAHLVLHDIDGSATGLAIAALREQYLSDNPQVSEIVTSFSYGEILRSFVETALVLAIDLAQASFVACDCDDPGCPNQESDPEITPLVAGRILVAAALNFEHLHYSHLDHCRTCAKAGHLARGLLRSRFCRDLADDLLTNADCLDVVVRGVPHQAAFDVVCALISTLSRVTGVSVEQYVTDMSRGVAMATGYAEGHFPDPAAAH